MAAAFAHELGVFDPTFPGITLHFPNEATWKKVGEVNALYYRLGSRDLLEKNPGLSPMTSIQLGCSSTSSRASTTALP